MNNSRIRVEYDALEQIARQCDNAAQSTEELLKRIRRGVEALEQGGWKGRGAEGFFDEMDNEVLPALGRLVAALDHTREVVQTASRRFDEAENNAARLFNRGALPPQRDV